MERRDGADAGRLRGTCPRKTYEGPHVAFDDRLTLALDTVTVASIEFQGLYGRLHGLDWAVRVVRPTATLHDLNAEMAVLEGVVACEGAMTTMPSDEDVEALVGQAANRLPESANATVVLLDRVARDVAQQLVVGREAVNVFARTRLGVTRDTLLRSRGLPDASKIESLLTTYARGHADPAKVKTYVALLAEPWDARFGDAHALGHGVGTLRNSLTRRTVYADHQGHARGDESDTDRLEDTCPTFTYRCEDAAFRDRMRRAHVLALHARLQMRGPLAQLRIAAAFRETCSEFAKGVVNTTQAAFLCGRRRRCTRRSCWCSGKGLRSSAGRASASKLTRC